MYKVSLIIPIYGVEKYIERCARSLFEQTLPSVEFIFVNDCTKDNSIKILEKIIEEYPNRKHHVSIINHEFNKGLPQARRTGIKNAKGEFIAHCDSDDWMDKNMLSDLYNHAILHESDIVYCDYYISDSVKSLYISQKKQRVLLQGPIWNKLVRSKLYKENEIIYPVCNKAEDGALMTQLSFYTSKIDYLSKPLYYYYNNPDSICRNNTIDSCISKLEQEKENVSLIESFLKSRNSYEKYKDEVILWKYLARKNLLPYIKDKTIYKMWEETYPEIDKVFLRMKSIPFKTRLQFCLIKLQLFSLLDIFNGIKTFTMFKKRSWNQSF